MPADDFVNWFNLADAGLLIKNSLYVHRASLSSEVALHSAVVAYETWRRPSLYDICCRRPDMVDWHIRLRWPRLPHLHTVRTCLHLSSAGLSLPHRPRVSGFSRTFLVRLFWPAKFTALCSVESIILAFSAAFCAELAKHSTCSSVSFCCASKWRLTSSSCTPHTIRSLSMRSNDVPKLHFSASRLISAMKS